MKPIIEPGQVQLPDGTEETLKEMFAGHARVVVKAEFGGGLGGGQVFLVRPIRADGDPTLSKVVKIASETLIKKEAGAYKEHIRDRWPRTAQLWAEPILPNGSERGGICYPMVGDGLTEPKISGGCNLDLSWQKVKGDEMKNPFKWLHYQREVYFGLSFLLT